MSRDFIEEDNYKEHDYITYGRQFDSYRWFKPILTMVLFVIFYIILSVLLILAAGASNFINTGGDINGFTERLTGGYDEMNVYDLLGAVTGLGTVTLMIPALAMARGIVRDRSFSSYSSSRGGWSHTVFLKSLLVAIVICGGVISANVFLINEPGAYNNQFTKYGLIALCILCPLQCMAEEYVFRGLICQTLGGWLRLPILAIVISSLGFAAMHPYNRLGQIAIFVSGLAFGLSSWIGHGIEVSSAFHIANNMFCFLYAGFGYDQIKTEVTTGEVIVDVAMGAAYVAAIFFISRKTDWFDRIRYDDAGDWNDIMDDKFRAREAKKAAKRAKKEARKNK